MFHLNLLAENGGRNLWNSEFQLELFLDEIATGQCQVLKGSGLLIWMGKIEYILQFLLQQNKIRQNAGVIEITKAVKKRQATNNRMI